MKRCISLFSTLAIVMVFSYGCASKEYVRQQIDPLVDRISKLEAMTQGLKDCCGKADAAVQRAEAAAKRAEAAADKCAKSFELQQKK